MRSIVISLLVLCGAASAQAQDTSPGRGQLLYSTHCVECHTTQMHWRAQRLARDWDSLRAQVRRFQGVAGLDWSEDDITAVTGHLNDTIYRFPQRQARR